jgi:hypothetical protein
MGDCKAPQDICRVATMASPLLQMDVAKVHIYGGNFGPQKSIGILVLNGFQSIVI